MQTNQENQKASVGQNSAPETNARLIAAAPELLEIVKQFESHVVCLNEMYGDQAPMSAGIVELALKARVAIAKAKGGAS